MQYNRTCLACKETKEIPFNYVVCWDCIWHFIDGCDGVAEYGPCVYALINEDRQIVYIGKTHNPGERLNQHLLTDKSFDRMVILSWNSTDEHARKFESFAIRELKPKYNKVQPKIEGKTYMKQKLRRAMRDYGVTDAQL